MDQHRSAGGEADQRRWMAAQPDAGALERSISLDDMPYEPWPSVIGIDRGMLVVGVEHGRRFRVIANDEWVVEGAYDRKADVERRTATGPYVKLQALDDKNCTVIWPRAWYMPEWMGDLL